MFGRFRSRHNRAASLNEDILGCTTIDLCTSIIKMDAEDTDLRLCFRIISPSKSYTLQVKDRLTLYVWMSFVKSSWWKPNSFMSRINLSFLWYVFLENLENEHPVCQICRHASFRLSFLARSFINLNSKKRSFINFIFWYFVHLDWIFVSWFFKLVLSGWKWSW